MLPGYRSTVGADRDKAGTADRVAAMRRRRRQVTMPTAPEIPDSRQLDTWRGFRAALKYYWPGVFFLPWSRVHTLVIQRLHDCLHGGGQRAVGLSRGWGKTSLIQASMLLAMLSGIRRYVVAISATDKKSRDFIAFVLAELTYNERLRTDFPDLAEYFTRARGTALGAGNLINSAGDNAGFRLSVQAIQFPFEPGRPWSGAKLDSFGVTSQGIRGLKTLDRDGVGRRPDFVIVDDPQSRETATSAALTAKLLQIVRGDCLGLGGPGSQVAVFCACTVISPGDLSDQLLDSARSPEWSPVKSPMVDAWPEGDALQLWHEYEALYRFGLSPSDEEPARRRAATAFYRANRRQMDAGFKVVWPAWKRPGEVSGCQAAWDLRMSIGEEAFAAEYQQNPIRASVSLYDLSPELVAARVGGCPRLVLERPAAVITAACDVNHYGLHWVVVATFADASIAVVDYGRYPVDGAPLVGANASDEEIDRAITDGCRAVLDRWSHTQVLVNGTACAIDAATIDANYRRHVVTRITAPGLRYFIPSIGIGANKYQVPESSRCQGEPGTRCHVYLPRNETAPVLEFDADFWRMRCQRAWLSGGVGTATLWRDTPAQHREFAEHVAAERLADYAVGLRGVPIYVWHCERRVRHDWGDALYMACALSSNRLANNVQVNYGRLTKLLNDLAGSRSRGEEADTDDTDDPDERIFVGRSGPSRGGWQ